jgi:hypothetical protein
MSPEVQERLTFLSPRAGSPEWGRLDPGEEEELDRLQTLRKPLNSAMDADTTNDINRTVEHDPDCLDARLSMVSSEQAPMCTALAERRKTATYVNGHQKALQGTKPARGRNKGEMVIAALLTSASVPDVAASVGCSVRTIYRYLGDESFKRMYAEAKARLLDEAILKLRNASGQAVDTLIEVCRDQYAPVPCRVAAARSIVQLAIQAGQMEELEQRLQLVEMNSIEGIATR